MTRAGLAARLTFLAVLGIVLLAACAPGGPQPVPVVHVPVPALHMPTTRTCHTVTSTTRYRQGGRTVTRSSTRQVCA